MNIAVDELVRSIIDKNSLAECSVDELQQLTQQYPYFGPAQFLLAKKYKEEASPLYEQQYQRTVLYFRDQLWFDYLADDAQHTGIITTAPVEVTLPVEKPVVNEIIPEETIAGSIVTEEAVADLPATLPTETPAVNEPAEVMIGDPHEPVTKEEMIEPLSSTDLLPGINEEPLPVNDNDTKPAATEPPELKIAPMDTAANTNTLTFEPYHTVDYFASQGIRYREEDKPKDRFTQQLKSFTEWLKAMKRLPESEIPKTAPPDDKKVTQMAEHSIENRDVVTEAMAEVWEKQGNNSKAIDIYSKLSLLNPDKTAYFAAKIEHLKTL